MSLPVISAISTIFFGILAIIFSFREEKARKTLKEKEQDQKHKLYELSIIKEIQDRIGYELDIEKIIDVIKDSLPNFFSYSAVSSIVIKENKLLFKIHLQEGVNQVFIEKVKKGMIASLNALVSASPVESEDYISGLPLNLSNDLPPSSFFHIPLIVSNNVVGIITISSTKPDLYKEDQMTILYQITNQASNALTSLQTVLTTEKGKLISLITSLADGVFMMDTNDRLLVINQAAKNILHIQKDKPTVLDVVSTLPSRYNFADKIQKSISQNIRIEEKEVIVEDSVIQVFITPVLNDLQSGLNKNESPKVLGASVLLHDITLEKNLAQMKEDFTNIMVHELRAPLTAIRGASKLLLSDGDKINKDQNIGLASIIYDQSQKLLEDVSSLLDAAKLESGRFTIEKAPTDVKKLIADKIQVFSPQAQNKEIILVSQINESLPIISLDSFRLGQVLNNLISNSLKFTPKGGRITISAKEIKKQEVAGGIQPFIEISVSDTGIGIPKDKQDKLFSKFSQINHPGTIIKEISNTEAERNSFHNAGLGSGLGLYITKGIVEAHGGVIYLDSDIGKGTSISFTIPLLNY